MAVRKHSNFFASVLNTLCLHHLSLPAPSMWILWHYPSGFETLLLFESPGSIHAVSGWSSEADWKRERKRRFRNCKRNGSGDSFTALIMVSNRNGRRSTSTQRKNLSLKVSDPPYHHFRLFFISLLYLFSSSSVFLFCVPQRNRSTWELVEWHDQFISFVWWRNYIYITDH